jgi:hypothetical protein
MFPQTFNLIRPCFSKLSNIVKVVLNDENTLNKTKTKKLKLKKKKKKRCRPGILIPQLKLKLYLEEGK